MQSMNIDQAHRVLDQPIVDLMYSTKVGISYMITNHGFGYDYVAPVLDMGLPESSIYLFKKIENVLKRTLDENGGVIVRDIYSSLSKRGYKFYTAVNRVHDQYSSNPVYLTFFVELCYSFGQQNLYHKSICYVHDTGYVIFL